MISQEELKRRYYYDKISGDFYARFGTKNLKPWRKVGSADKNGYLQIKISEVNYYSHRLALLYVTGINHRGHVDHINGIKLDNRLDNLRMVTGSVNGQNRKQCNTNSSTGVLGVHKKREKFRARITVERTEINLGVFDTPEDAHQAYLTAKRKYHEGNTL